MSVNIKPFFKGALIVQAIVVACLSLATLFFMSQPSATQGCLDRLQENQYGYKYVPWLHNKAGIIGLSGMSIACSAIILVIGALGFKRESASILRHLRLAIVVEAAICFATIMDLTFSIALFKGETWYKYQEMGCSSLTSAVGMQYAALIVLFVYSLPLSIILDAYLKSIGDELSFFDYLTAWVYHVRNCVKYGRQGISFTSSFVRSQVRTRFARSVRVAQKNDTLFREVEIGSRMFGAVTLDLLKENIAHKYDRHPNEIVRLTKNGNVLILDDADVARLSDEDHVEVEFENRGEKLQEINSIILEDSVSETRIEM